MITEPKKILFILISLFFVRFTYGIAIGVPAKFEHFPNDSFPQILWNNGFWHSRIDSTRGDTIFITLGKPAIAESIAAKISDSLEQIVMLKLIYRVGDTIRKSKIEKQQEIFVDALENNGYPFASCYGTGRIINFTLSAYEKNREIEIGYREPFLWNSNISPQISSKWTIKDSTYTKREHKLGVFIPLGYETDLYTGFITDRTVPGSANNSISDGESFGLEFSARYSTLDDAILHSLLGR